VPAKTRTHWSHFLISIALIGAISFVSATALAQVREQIIREGVVVDFTAEPATGFSELIEGGFADIRFRITSAEDDEPLRGVYPGVWIDLTKTPDGEGSGVGFDCRTRVTQYLQGLVGMRPMIDMNSYYVLVLNRDPSISVIDPVVGITGITSLYATVNLKRPGADWVKSADEKTLYVSMPRAGEVAIVDLDTFKVTHNIGAGVMPTRVVLQPDEKYLWVGNNAEGGDMGGVTIIDRQSNAVVAEIETGAGHHEISFTGDSRHAFVTNRESGSVSVIDVAALEKIAEIPTGPMPISIDWSPLSEFMYVADGRAGRITVIDADSLALVRQIEVNAGLGPTRFSQDGRWGFTVNPLEDEVYVIDATTNELSHTLEMTGRPFQVHVSRSFAYIRALDTEQVRMINLQELDRNGDIIVNNFAAGSFPPSRAPDVAIADTLAPAAQEAAMLVASPGDATVYYYMEGMNAPMGAFRNYGHQPRSVQIANRALKEVEPGLYEATVKLPVAGTFELAFLNETPEFLHCFTLDAAINPAIDHGSDPVAIDYLVEQRGVEAGDTVSVRFRLRDPRTNQAYAGLDDVRVRSYRAPRFDLVEMPATHVGDGIYAADLKLVKPGGYYLFVAVKSLGLDFDDLDFLTLMATQREHTRAAGEGESR